MNWRTQGDTSGGTSRFGANVNGTSALGNDRSLLGAGNMGGAGTVYSTALGTANNGGGTAGSGAGIGYAAGGTGIFKNAAPSGPTSYRTSTELDWGRLSKVEIAQRIFPVEVFDSYTRPEAIEAKFKQVGEQEKKTISSDMDDLLKGFIEIVDDLKSQMQSKVDMVVESYLQKYRLYNQGVDQLSTKATDMLKRLENENSLNLNNASAMDQLTRDIEMMRLKKASAIKSEEILINVKSEVERERMLDKFKDFKKVLNREVTLYQEKEAEQIYRRLVTELTESIKNKPSLRNLDLIRDPFSMRTPYQIQSVNGGQGMNNVLPGGGYQGQNTLDVTSNNNNNVSMQNALNATAQKIGSDGQSLILHQNHSMIDRGFLKNPRIVLDRTYYTKHRSDIIAVTALNQRYIAVSSSDRTVQVWDLNNQSTSVVTLSDFDGDVATMKKILVDPNHPLGCLLITVENIKSVDNIGVFNLATSAAQVPSVYSREHGDMVTALDVLNSSAIVAGYQGGTFRVLDVKTLNTVYNADLKTRIDCILVLPDRKTVVVACDNEYTILDVSSALQVSTKAKRRDTASFGFLRSLGRNSEVFCGFLKNGMIKMYRTIDGECLNVVLGQRGEYDSSLVLNFFSADPSVYLLTLSKHSPFFRYCNIDDTEMKSLPVENGAHSVCKGDPKMQIIDLVPGSHVTFATVGNFQGKPPGLMIWRLSFN